ncbi:MAG: hypothetical protein AAFQ35_12445, partial [Pseudomonadota bacterium]
MTNDRDRDRSSPLREQTRSPSASGELREPRQPGQPREQGQSGALDPTVSSDGDVAAFLDAVNQLAPTEREAGSRGRLIFAMDATMSRQPTWDLAQSLQADMFSAVRDVGGLDVQLVYFRGFRECQSSKWVRDPAALARLMTSVSCRIAHPLGRLAFAETAEVNKLHVKPADIADG